MLVTAEVALSIVLLVAAALLFQSWQRVLRVDPGFRADGLATVRVSLPTTYKDDAAVHSFYSRAQAQLASLPAVTGVTMATSLPISGGDGTGDLTIEGRAAAPGELGAVTTRRTTPEYFRVMGIPLVRGRVLTSMTMHREFRWRLSMKRWRGDFGPMKIPSADASRSGQGIYRRG
jgi:putative ABC transport system permease protein